MGSKSKLVSMIVSEKALFSGHRFRLALYEALRSEPAVYPVHLPHASPAALLSPALNRADGGGQAICNYI